MRRRLRHVHSTVGWSRPGQHALLSLEDGKPTLPSAIFFHDEDNEVSYGRAPSPTIWPATTGA